MSSRRELAEAAIRGAAGPSSAAVMIREATNEGRRYLAQWKRRRLAGRPLASSEAHILERFPAIAQGAAGAARAAGAPNLVDYIIQIAPAAAAVPAEAAIPAV